MVDEDLREHVSEVRKKFPEFDTFPPAAQEALLDMQYNSGLNPSEWPKLFGHVRNRNWLGAVGEVNRPQVDIDRNDWTRRKMNEADRQQKNK